MLAVPVESAACVVDVGLIDTPQTTGFVVVNVPTAVLVESACDFAVKVIVSEVADPVILTETVHVYDAPAAMLPVELVAVVPEE
jgi:hypothetical protein